jgi:hypothetical protein
VVLVISFSSGVEVPSTSPRTGPDEYDRLRELSEFIAHLGFVRVERMWWRVLAVAVVLLCAGVAGGYAVADHTEEDPATSSVLVPMPAQSPAVPTPSELPTEPDPDNDPLESDLSTEPVVLRLAHRGAGVVAQVPEGWRHNRLPDSDTWTFTQEGNPTNTFGLRIQLVFGVRQAVSVSKTARIAALESAVAQGHMFDLHVTAQVADTIEANYIDEGGFRRYTVERWVAFDGDTAYVDVAATGRVVDQDGLRDLVSRTASTMTKLAAGEDAPSTD